MDIKLKCINNFRLIELTERNHFVLDRIKPLSIYNALIASEKGHPFLLMAINKIADNVNKNYYGTNPLEPTGPVMLGNLILNNKIRLNIDLVHFIDGGFVTYKNRFIISTEYPEYNSERINQNNEINKKRYDVMWNERKIYL